MGELIDGAMQQAAQRSRHCMGRMLSRPSAKTITPGSALNDNENHSQQEQWVS
jgi:hypothetical protein